MDVFCGKLEDEVDIEWWRSSDQCGCGAAGTTMKLFLSRTTN
jgi:hypothetical protein